MGRMVSLRAATFPPVKSSSADDSAESFNAYLMEDDIMTR